MSDVVTYEVAERVAVVTINRPDVRNAMNLEVFDALGEAARRAGEDDDVRAVLLRGADGNFSSGLDTSVMTDLAGQADDAFIIRLQESFTAFEEIDKPSVALIEGYCLGGGIQVAAACHVRLVAPDAQISVLERRWGLIPDLGGTWRLPRLVGLGTATEMVLTARTVDAEEALTTGLGQVAVGAHDPYSDALAWTAKLAAGPGATRRAPRLLRENLGRSREDGLAAEREVQLACLASGDPMEAFMARMQEREPEF